MQLFDCGSIEYFILLKLQPTSDIEIFHDLALRLDLDVALLFAAVLLHGINMLLRLIIQIT